MKMEPTMVLSRIETAALAAAARHINVLLPTDGPDAVPQDDPRRKMMRQISQPNESYTQERLSQIYLLFDELRKTLYTQSTRSYWSGLHDGLEHHRDLVPLNVQTMINTLAEARLLQYRDVILACEMVRSAVALMMTTAQAASNEDLFDTAADAAFSLLSCDLQMRDSGDGDVTGVIGDRSEYVYPGVVLP